MNTILAKSTNSKIHSILKLEDPMQGGGGSGMELPVLARRVGLWLLYLRVYWELEDKLSIWEYLLDPFCRLPASEVVCRTDRYQEIIQIQ